jgi:hypothetical protein
MAVSVTISLDAEILQRLRAEAQARGVAVDALVHELLKEKFEAAPATTTVPPYRDLDALAGTWSDEEAAAFLSVIADFEHVDEDMWK